MTSAALADLRPIDLGMLVTDAVPLLKTMLPASLDLIPEIADAPMTVQGDSVQLVEALTNLVMNASDSMPGGGVVRLRMLPYGDAGFRLQVEDRGHGMPADVAAHAFDPYFTTKEVGRGTGLGFAQVQQTAIEHGAKVSLESAPNQGTTVSLWFPETSEVPLEQTKPTPMEFARGPGDPPLVWLIEDDELVTEALNMWLDRHGYEVVSFGQAIEALAWIDGHSLPAVVVTDMTMPGMSGIAFIERLRARVGTIPAILISGHAVDSDEAGINAPFVFVPKPIDLDSFASSLRRLSSLPASAWSDTGAK